MIQFTRGGGPDNPKVSGITVAGESGNNFTLTVNKAGTGSGTVTSSPAGINCGSTCSASYASGTSVTLTPSAASGSTFAGWSGACSGTGSCAVNMNTNQTVTATFNPTGGGDTVSINAGGSATGSFAADQYFSGGSTYTNTATIDMSQITSNPPPAAIFNTERYGAMTYTIPNRSGAQTVTLYFAETYVTAAGQRLFNVSINGTTVLDQLRHLRLARAAPTGPSPGPSTPRPTPAARW